MGIEVQSTSSDVLMNLAGTAPLDLRCMNIDARNDARRTMMTMTTRSRRSAYARSNTEATDFSHSSGHINMTGAYGCH